MRFLNFYTNIYIIYIFYLIRISVWSKPYQKYLNKKKIALMDSLTFWYKNTIPYIPVIITEVKNRFLILKDHVKLYGRKGLLTAIFYFITIPTTHSDMPWRSLQLKSLMVFFSILSFTGNPLFITTYIVTLLHEYLVLRFTFDLSMFVPFEINALKAINLLDWIIGVPGKDYPYTFGVSLMIAILHISRIVLSGLTYFELFKKYKAEISKWCNFNSPFVKAVVLYTLMFIYVGFIIPQLLVWQYVIGFMLLTFKFMNIMSFKTFIMSWMIFLIIFMLIFFMIHRISQFMNMLNYVLTHPKYKEHIVNARRKLGYGQKAFNMWASYELLQGVYNLHELLYVAHTGYHQLFHNAVVEDVSERYENEDYVKLNGLDYLYFIYNTSNFVKYKILRFSIKWSQKIALLLNQFIPLKFFGLEIVLDRKLKTPKIDKDELKFDEAIRGRPLGGMMQGDENNHYDEVFVNVLNMFYDNLFDSFKRTWYIISHIFTLSYYRPHFNEHYYIQPSYIYERLLMMIIGTIVICLYKIKWLIIIPILTISCLTIMNDFIGILHVVNLMLTQVDISWMKFFVEHFVPLSQYGNVVTYCRNVCFDFIHSPVSRFLYGSNIGYMILMWLDKYKITHRIISAYVLGNLYVLSHMGRDIPLGNFKYIHRDGFGRVYDQMPVPTDTGERLSLFLWIIDKHNPLHNVGLYMFILSLLIYNILYTTFVKMCRESLSLFLSVTSWIAFCFLIPDFIFQCCIGEFNFFLEWCKAKKYESFEILKEWIIKDVKPRFKHWVVYLKIWNFLGKIDALEALKPDKAILSSEEIQCLRDIDNLLIKMSRGDDLTVFEKKFYDDLLESGELKRLRELQIESKKLMTRRQLQLFKTNWVNMTRMVVKKFVMRLDDFKLPEFIQAQYKSPTPASIRASYQVLLDMGYPIDQGFIDSIRAPNDSDYLAEWASYKQWLMAVSDFKMGLPKITAAYDSFMADFGFDHIPGYMHTINFTGINEEIKATSRYWTQNIWPDNIKKEDIDDVLAETFEAIKPQYGNPKLASPEFILKHWVKKYNVGFGFRIPVFRTTKTGEKVFKRWKQMKRSYLIEACGGAKGFLQKFKKLFKYAPSLTSVSSAFTKMDTLKAKKSINRAVRTVVSSAFIHHVASTIFSYKPNHNYKPFETPIKVGMPINGQAFNHIWVSVAKHDAVWAGDMTAFDSSLHPRIIKLVAEVRKITYKEHYDYHRIGELIDLCYDALIEQPMGFKHFGPIAKKHKGFSTGHSSTTPDNSIAVIVCYLLAWRKITNLRCREFFNFNTLVNFGDDHLLGWDRVFGWDPSKAASVMKTIGVEMRDEANGEDRLPNTSDPESGKNRQIAFLSKQPLAMTPEIRKELEQCGVKLNLNFATCHVKNRLVGKIKAQTDQSKDMKWKYNRLISYMYLCAHHKDVYERIDCVLEKLYDMNKRKWKKENFKPDHRPSYKEVVRMWYQKGIDIKHMDFTDENVDDDGEFVMIHQNTPLDYIIRWLSDVPTMLSPRYTNTRWADWIQDKMGMYLSWPLSVINRMNECQNNTKLVYDKLSRTPYNFIRTHNTLLPNVDLNILMFRHHLYMLYTSIFGRQRYGFSILDYVRVLDHSFINLAFMILGKVTTILVELDLHIFDILMISVLNYINWSPYPSWIVDHIPTIDLITPSSFVGWVITLLVRTFSPNGSIDSQPMIARLKLTNSEGGFSLGAPTGTGKSTRLVNLIANETAKRTVVICPRRMIVMGVGSYMQKLYPHSGIGMQTEGVECELHHRIIYTTPQSFMLSRFLQDHNNFIILDEAHVDEPAYALMRKYIKDNYRHFIFLSATPDSKWGLDHVDLPAVSSFNITRIDKHARDLNLYMDSVAGFINSRDTTEKFLIFLPTLKMQYEMMDKLQFPVCIINSKDTFISDANVIITTSVADAGVTIPDIDFVFTSDIDIQVSQPDKQRRETNIIYYTLPESTILQRIGRTGRTSDGMAFVYHLGNAPTGIKHPRKEEFTYADYYNAYGEQIDNLRKYIDDHAFNMASHEYIDKTTRKAKIMTEADLITGMKFAATKVRDKLYTTFDTINSHVAQPYGYLQYENSLKESITHGIKAERSDPIKNLLDLLHDTTLVNDDNVPSKYTQVKPITDINVQEPHVYQGNRTLDIKNLPDGSSLHWGWVSGEGLLCGAFALGESLRYNNIDIDDDNVINGLRGMIDATIAAILGYENPDSFFDIGTMREYTKQYHNLSIALWDEGHETWVLDPEWLGDSLVIKLQAFHYYPSKYITGPIVDSELNHEGCIEDDKSSILSDNDNLDETFGVMDLEEEKKMYQKSQLKGKLIQDDSHLNVVRDDHESGLPTWYESSKPTPFGIKIDDDTYAIQYMDDDFIPEYKDCSKCKGKIYIGKGPLCVDCELG